MRLKPALALVAAGAVLLAGCFGQAANVAPVVNAHASVASVAVGDEVVFTGTAVDTDGSIVRMSWDFTSDGTADFVNATRGATVFRFPIPGVFVATFSAEDDRGATASVTVNITVLARFTFNADWGADAGFVVNGAPTLDPALITVSASPASAPAAFTFRQGEGLVALNNTSYRVSIPATEIQRYASVRVEASYNGTPSGFRDFRAVPFFGAENDSSVVYDAVLDEVRLLASGNTTIASTGSLASKVVASTAVLSFSGSGTSDTPALEGVAMPHSFYTLDALTWNHSVSTSTGAFNAIDFAWNGTGRLTTVDETGFHTDINLSEYRGARYLGNLTNLHLQGTGGFWADGAPTSGSITYAADGNRTELVVDGEAHTRLALPVVETQTFNGTLGGAAYDETNVSLTLQAASDMLVNTPIHTAWNSSGHLGVTPLSTTGARYLDSDGDGSFNPDLRPRLPYDGQYFAGLAPAELEPGDAFVVHNADGATARLVASDPRPEILAASGFTPVAVNVVTVEGNVTGAGFSGALSADIVANGAHNLLRLKSEVTLATSTGSLHGRLTLAARGS